MSRTGRTLTRTMSIETRQHSLFGIDLGDGPPRAALIWCVVVFFIWFGLMLTLFQGGPSKATVPLWIGPPTALGLYGWQESTRSPRRRRVTEWALCLRWITRGHRPVIALGRRVARPDELPGLLERLAQRMGSDDLLVLVMPWRRHDEEIQQQVRERVAARAQQRASRPILLRQQVQLIGTATTNTTPAARGRRRHRSDHGPNELVSRRAQRVALLTGANAHHKQGKDSTC